MSSCGTSVIVSHLVGYTIFLTDSGWAIVIIFLEQLPLFIPYIMVSFLALADLIVRPWNSSLMDKVGIPGLKVKSMSRSSFGIGIGGFLTFVLGSVFLTGYFGIRLFLFMVLLLALISYFLLLRAHFIGAEETHEHIIAIPKNTELHGNYKTMNIAFIMLICYTLMYKSLDVINIYYVLDILHRPKEYQFQFVSAYFIGYTIAPFILRWFIQRGIMVLTTLSFTTISLYYITLLYGTSYAYFIMVAVGFTTALMGLYINTKIHTDYSGVTLLKMVNKYQRYASMGPLIALVGSNIFVNIKGMLFLVYIPILLALEGISVVVGLLTNKKKEGKTIYEQSV